MAYNTAASNTYTATTNIVAFNATDFNIGGAYSTTTNKFTAPKNGIYHFDLRLAVTPGSNQPFGTFFIIISVYNATGVLQSSYNNASSGTNTDTLMFSLDLKMNNTDYTLVNVTNCSISNSLGGTSRFSTFSGHYVCGL